MPGGDEEKGMHWRDVGIRRESCLCMKDLLSEILVAEKNQPFQNLDLQR